MNRLETCKIILHGNAEFEASNVTIEVKRTNMEV